MGDRPLLLPGWAVRAVLREVEAPGTGKSQHRVIIKNRGMLPDFRGPNGCQADPECWGWEDGESGYHIGIVPSSDGDYQDFWQPFAVGDRLWARETWADLTLDPLCDLARSGMSGAAYRATDDDEMTIPPKWRSSATMPRWASRLTLLVTDVRVQRAHEITEEDARAEGYPLTWDEKPYDPPPPEVDSWQGYGRASMCLSWNKRFGPGAWQRNPWVLAMTFRPIPRNIDMEA